MSLLTWALRHGVGPAALNELQIELGLLTPGLPAPEPSDAPMHSEAYAQSEVLLEASAKGIRLSRNNVGALIPQNSKRPVRFGLWNQSAEVNDIVGSSDLIGWRRVVITPAMVGFRIAQFLAREVKEPGWQFTGNDPHKVKQKAFIDMVNADGGDAAFCTGKGSL